MMRNALIAGLLGMVLLYAWERSRHTQTRTEMARQSLEHAAQLRDYAVATAERSRALSEAVEREQALTAALRQRESELVLAARRDRLRADNERTEAETRIRALEAINAELKNWADTRIPAEYIDWMREPTAALPTAGDDRGPDTGVSGAADTLF